MTLQEVLKRVKSILYPKQKRRRVVYASRSKLTLNQAEERFCKFYGTYSDRLSGDRLCRYAADCSEISMRVAKLWLKKPKIDACWRTIREEMLLGQRNDKAQYLASLTGATDEQISAWESTLPRILPAENDPGDGA